MTTNSITNRPLRILEKNDTFNTLPKANLLSNFIINRIADLKINNMIALYGQWGCGKSTVLKHVYDKISISNTSGNFKPVFFEAWRYEKDNNLTISLFDCVCDSLKDSRKDSNIKAIGNILRSIAYSVTFKTPFIDFDASKANKKEKELKEAKSIYGLEKELQDNFKKFLISLPEHLIVLIDDLDRCQPENIVNLLSDIKLFFTLGSNTNEESFYNNIVFVCAVDKEAIIHAVDFRYKKHIKSEEYLEKIFDFTFNMPRLPDVDSFIRKIFTTESQAKWVTLLFKEIKFTNPRHLIKVINKFNYLKSLKVDAIGDIDNPENELLTILMLYLIILHEFHKEQYYEFRNYEQKEDKFFVKPTNSNNIVLNFSKDLIYTIKLSSLKFLGTEDYIETDKFDVNKTIHAYEIPNDFDSGTLFGYMSQGLKRLELFLPNKKWTFDADESIYHSLNRMKTYLIDQKMHSMKIMVDFCLFLAQYGKNLNFDIEKHDCNFIILLNTVEDYL